MSADTLHVIDLKAIATNLAANLAETLSVERPVVATTERLRPRKQHVKKSYGKRTTIGREILPINPFTHAEMESAGERLSRLELVVRKAVSDAFGTNDRCLVIEGGDPLVDQTLIDVIERVPEIVHARRERMTQENIDQLVDTFLKTEPAASARAAIEFDNARERARFREEVDCYTSRDVAELAGHSASNASATTTRWKSARRIIGLPWKDGDLYPAFQFQDGRPRPAIGRILAELPDSMTPWQIAFWLTSSNSWLDGAAPADRLDDGDAVVIAARREGEKLVG